MTADTSRRGRSYNQRNNVPQRDRTNKKKKKTRWKWRTCPRDTPRHSGTGTHRRTRPTDAPHATTGGPRTRSVPLLALQPFRFIAHRALELLLFPPLPFALRRPLPLLLLAPPRLFPHAFLLLELRLVLKTRRKRRLKKFATEKRGALKQGDGRVPPRRPSIARRR